MEEGKRFGYLATSRQYGNALLGVRHQEEEEEPGAGLAPSNSTIANTEFSTTVSELAHFI